MCGQVYGTTRARAAQAQANGADGEHEGLGRRLWGKCFGVPSAYVDQHSVILRQHSELIETHGGDNWRVRGYRLLHQHWFILMLALLMVADIIFMMADLVLSAFHPGCAILMAGVHCLAESHDGSAHDGNGTCMKECVESPGSVERAKLGMTIASLIILTIFLIELHFHMAIVGLRKFFSSIFLVSDWLIILISIGLEIYLLIEETRHGSDDENVAVEASTVPLLIFARSWRLLRIGHGSYKEAHDFYGEKMRKLKTKNRSLRRRLREAGIETSDSSDSDDDSRHQENTVRKRRSIKDQEGLVVT